MREQRPERYGLLVIAYALTCSACQPPVRAIEVEGVATHEDAQVRKGDRLNADEDLEVIHGRVVLGIERFARVRVYAKTRLRVHAARHKVSIRLARGKLWSVVRRERGDTRFEVLATNAIVVAQGTEFIVESTNARETDVRVIEGAVEVSNPAVPSQGRTLKAGERSRVRGDEPPSQPSPYDPGQDRALWDRLKILVSDAVELTKDAGRTLGEAAQEAAPQIEKGLKEGGRKLGKGLKEGGRELGKGLKEGGRKLKKGLKDIFAD